MASLSSGTLLACDGIWSEKHHNIFVPLPVEGKASPHTKQLIEDQVLEAMELLGVAYKPSAYNAACKVLNQDGIELLILFQLAIIFCYRLNAMLLISMTTPLQLLEKAYIHCTFPKCSVLLR